ncbi:hypothetical protein PSM36_0133 [Proteiniphilum saccharofermentans]|uniref:Uncharacterized protein n=1 Tax=Proteiniphilum saccharofermentans TaxID=1642647 RepID=A0A1R3SYK2_9BACT|nr:hypothetical protein [Proteiniphilum saccharofermentans]SCD18969.1 hypothetical protein PSM36_0133 [Proteiniphilum saccharofermentans]
MKKKEKQSPQILSPENYIRQRARNLPIYKCFVNEDWEDAGIAHVTIARKHINGNITYCSYLVDLKCLGIKDTLYEFNIPEYEFDEYKRKLDTGLNMVESDYGLVHNIIHAGWEYAEDIGFEPHKDFLSTTQYMLEEDSDDIPLIEIACGGENGKPLFVQGPLEDDTIANTIINSLKKRLGAGHFDYLLGGNNPMFDESYDDWDDEDDWDDLDIFHEEYIDNSYSGNAAIFLKLTQHLDDDEFGDDRGDEDPDDDESFKRIEALTDILYDDLVDFEDVNRWITKWRKEARDYTITNAARYQMMGLQNKDEIAYEDLSYLTKEIEDAKLQKYVREKWGELPYVTFLELQGLNDPTEKKARIAQALDQYPDYALLKLEDKTAKIQDKKLKKTELSFKSLFGDRKEITPYEYVKWQVVMLHYFASTYDLAGIESLFLFNDPEIHTEHHQINMFLSVLYATRISVLRMFLLEP